LSRQSRPSRRIVIGVSALGFTAAGVGAASAVPIGAVTVASAPHVAHGTRAGDSAEAWYTTPSGSLCVPLLGCLPVPLPLPSTYPAGTLHVGLTAGAESARAYVVPAVASLVKRGALGGGELILPIDTSPLGGTSNVSSARIEACLTTGTLPAHGSASAALTGTPPKVDCKVSVAAKYDKASNQFVVYLPKFADAWFEKPYRGIALLPVASGFGALDTWQVAFDGKGSKATSLVHSLIEYTPSHGPGPSSLPKPGAHPGASKPTQVTPPAIAFPTTGTQGVVPPVSPPQIAPGTTSADYLVRSGRFRYPAIFIAPLAILAGVIFFGRLFTGASVRPRTRVSRNRARS
jgi:hypothetical protein